MPTLPAVDTLVDTIRVIDQQAYIDLLEKTNQQMSLWWNPYGVMIAALGILFAAGAVFATVLLYRQSREHRDQIQAFLEASRIQLSSHIKQHQSLVNDMIAATNQRTKVAIEQLQAQADSADQMRKLELEKEIEALRAQLIDRAPQEPHNPSGPRPSAGRPDLLNRSSAWRRRIPTMIRGCANCGHTGLSETWTHTDEGLACPDCGCLTPE